MAVKCNITKVVLEKVESNGWGLSPSKERDRTLLENYVEFLACPDFSLKYCTDYEDTCIELNKANTLVVNCNLNVIGMSFTKNTPSSQNPQDITFFLSITDIYGAKQPLTYKWTYDTNIFDIVGSINSPTVQFKVKPGKKIDLVVAPITVEIVDANGCKDTKQCYFTGDGMKCNASFKPCTPVKALIVTPVVVTCSRPRALVVKDYNQLVSNVLIITGQGKIYKYNPVDNSKTFLYQESPIGSADIGHTDSKIFTCIYGTIKEYNYNILTDSIVFSRSINVPIGLSAGWCAIDNNNIVSDYFNAGVHKLVKINVSNSTATVNDLFTLPADRYIAGDIMYNSVADTYIMSMFDTLGRQFISEYYSNGSLKADIQHTYDSIYGLYSFLGTPYAVKYDGKIYKIELTGLTLVGQIPDIFPDGIYGASQIPNYNNSTIK